MPWWQGIHLTRFVLSYKGENYIEEFWEMGAEENIYTQDG
jgi:hypothetical protein